MMFRRAFLYFMVVLSALSSATGLDASRTDSLVQSNALQLVVYERMGCAWCARWDQEIAPIYPKTDVGQRVALKRVSLDRRSADDPVLDNPVRFTPTFVLLRDGKEAGRITGYHNDAFFWGLLESMVAQLPEKHP